MRARLYRVTDMTQGKKPVIYWCAETLDGAEIAQGQSAETVLLEAVTCGYTEFDELERKIEFTDPSVDLEATGT